MHDVWKLEIYFGDWRKKKCCQQVVLTLADHAFTLAAAFTDDRAVTDRKRDWVESSPPSAKRTTEDSGCSSMHSGAEASLRTSLSVSRRSLCEAGRVDDRALCLLRMDVTTQLRARINTKVF